MTIVIDASVIVKWAIPEEGSVAARALQSELLIAPSLWIAEVANMFWRHAIRGEISTVEAHDFFAAIQGGPIRSTDVQDDIAAALDLAADLNHPIYDCLYLALALRENTHVVTADRRFVAAVSNVPRLSGRVRPLA